MTLRYNTLVISDLHLGEDLRSVATEATTRHLAILERQLVAFLRHYSRRRIDGCPWRLVMNGDMVDFLSVCVRPGEFGLDPDAEEVTPDEHIYGVGRRPRAARAKLQAVFSRHHQIFRSIVFFLAAGNRLEIIAGNHDTEFQFPIVQKAFRQGLALIWSDAAASARPGAATPEQIEAAIGFHPWFFYEKGVVWIEHGHQYDECSSYEHGLRPLAPDGKHIAVNADSAALRYMSNHMEGAEVHSLQDWNMAGYLRYTFGLGVRGIGRTIKGYTIFIWSLLSAWRSHTQRRRARMANREVHLEKRRLLGEKFALSDQTLSAVDQLRKRPVVTNLRRLLAVAFFDRLIINGLALLASIFALFALPFLTALLVVAGIVVVARMANHWAGRAAKVDPEAALALMPPRIMSHVDARFVIFGHTHEPVAQPISDGRWYFNTGTWMPTDRPGFLRSFTHVVIRGGERGPRAHLRQWRDGASREFTPGWVPAGLGVPQHAPAEDDAEAREPQVA